MRKDPDRPRTTHSWPVGYPRRNGEPWASGCGLTFLAGAGVKGVEGGEWDGEPLRAARRQVLARGGPFSCHRQTPRSARPDPPGLRAARPAGGLPGFSGLGPLTRRFCGAGWEDRHTDRARCSFCGFIFSTGLPYLKVSNNFSSSDLRTKLFSEHVGRCGPAAIRAPLVSQPGRATFSARSRPAAALPSLQPPPSPTRAFQGSAWAARLCAL